MENPTELHLQATKKVLRYLKGQLGWVIFIGREEMINLLLTLTVIMLEIWMKEKVLLIMCSYYGWQSGTDRAGRSAVKNAGWVDVFNPLTHISPPRITHGSHGPAAGRGGLAR